MAEPWFNEVAFGSWFGVIAGCMEGGMGAALGTAAGILVPRGKGRPWLMAGCVLMSVVGLAALAFGLAALVSGQPYGIWYPPLLAGVLGFLFFLGVPLLRARYAEAERRRLEAEALRRT
jgi:ABC-type transport system involved in cytochrome c biogenesis permease subunit